MNRLAFFAVAALFIAPAVASAQETAPNSLIHCPRITQTLSFGSRDSQTNPRGQVSELQKFLSDYYDLDPDEYVTGYFGRLTRDSVRKFQCAKMGVCSGTEATNGYGVVGPKTRAAILASCGNVPTPPPPPPPPPPAPQCVPAEKPTTACNGGEWQPFTNAAGCRTGWTCVVLNAPGGNPNGNRPPLISAIVGPTTLKPNEKGTWKITATDPDGDQLKFSVVWGDEGDDISQLLDIIQQGTPYATTSTITHAYQKTGTYNMYVFAKDAVGNIVKATHSVLIHVPIVIPPIEPFGGGGGTGGTGSGGSYACYLNGQGYTAQDVSACKPPSYADARPPDGGSTSAQCEQLQKGGLVCTKDGWAGGSWGLGYANSRNITVGCTSHNGILIPGNTRVPGNRCFVDNPNATNCEATYICKRDGWWRLDSVGFEIERVTQAPWVAPETFYPVF